MNPEPLWILGAGGHSKVAIDAAHSSGRFRVVGLLDDDPSRWDTLVLDIPVRGAASPEVARRLGAERAIIAIGSNAARAELARRLDGLLGWATVVHRTAYLAQGVEVGEGTIVCAGAIVQPDSRIGRHAILNTASTVDHDSLVGDFSHLGPGVHLGGGVRIGSQALLGVASSVLPGRSVGDGATVGGGAVVVRDVPGGMTAIGIPARPLGRSRPAR